MKSKTFCFNRTIFMKNFTHFWPLWTLYLICLLLMIPVSLWQGASQDWYYGYQENGSEMYMLVSRALETALSPGPVFLIVAVMALAVFSYLYTAKSANMVHALPVSRLELFVTNYLSGLSFMVIPEVIAFLFTVLVCIGNEITCIQYLFIGFLCRLGMILFSYSLAVFVTMFTGHMLAMPVYYLIANYLYIGCRFLITEVVELLCYGISDFWNPGKTSILSPIYYLGNNLWVRNVYDDATNQIEGLEIHGIWLVGIYAAVAVVFAVAAYRLYRRRMIETAGDVISIGIIKPVFRWGVAMCGGISVSLLLTGVLAETQNTRRFPCFMICMFVTGFLFFFVAQMLIMKNFRVFRKKRLLEWCCFAIVSLLFVVLFETDLFGIERKIPAQEEIEAAFICMDYPIEIETAQIPELLKIHREIIQNKRQYREAEGQKTDVMYTTICYYLKDGGRMERLYPIPVQQETAQGEPTPAARILDWEREPENLKRHMLGRGYRMNEYLSGYIDLYDGEIGYQNYLFKRDELKTLVTAIEKDIDEGSYNKYYATSGQENLSETYYSNISMEYYNRDGQYDVWDYFYAYRRYHRENPVKEKAMSSTVFLTFGPECRHTIEALERMGVFESYRLETIEEYRLRTAYD